MVPPVRTSTPQMSRPDPGTASTARSGAPLTTAVGINDRGQIVGFYENPTFTPTPLATATPMGRMAWPPRR